MTASITIPHLLKGQLVAEWSKNYQAATSLLDDTQRVQLLPIYVARTPGEKAIAQLATEKTTYAEAIALIISLIDGERSKIQLTRTFFEITAPTDGDCTTVYFELQAAGVSAGIPNDVVFNRFLTFFKGGEKFYADNAAKIVATMTRETMLELFTDFKKKEDNYKGCKTVRFNEEKEELYTMSKEEEKPDWAEQVQEELKDLRSIVTEKLKVQERSDDDSVSDTEEGYYYNRGQTSQYKHCTICKRRNHTAATCFKRRCIKCKGLGHSDFECPSFAKSNNKKKPTRSDRSL